MNNNAAMQASFEIQKNIKASIYTVAICIAIALILFLLQWTLPQIPPPVLNEGIEVNLGNSETGSGDIPPQVPGDPSSTQETNATPPPSTAANNNTNITPDETNTDVNAPAVNNSNKSTPRTNASTNVKHNQSTNTTAVVPKPKKPKAVYGGGTNNNNGGNNADSYNGVRNQGVAGGNGDQGKPNGNPNSDSYNGNAASGNSGVSIRSGLNGRRFTKLPSFQDDFNENAKVAVDITVSKDGSVTQAIINPRGTTTTNPNIRNIALRKARLLKLNAGTDDEQTGTIVFNFKVTN
ncbi:MAG: hypothetical protein JSR09_00910 [Bacteroidetes bacterium]|nr:hypothetical protein [Bacteroidota bacterium]MBS1648239.1 hypothetical protein [Bacteroidota bacterium]